MRILHWTSFKTDPFSFIIVAPSCYHFFNTTQSHHFDFVLSWNFIPRTIFTFLWPDSILLYKGKMAMETRLFILFWIIPFDKKIFFISAYFSPFDLKSLLNQKLSSLKAKFCFCNWQMFQFFQMLLGYNFCRIGRECNKNMNWRHG